MDELIRTLAAFGRPFPPELRELYFQVENYPKRPRGFGQLAKTSADAAEGRTVRARFKSLKLGRQPRRQLIHTP